MATNKNKSWTDEDDQILIEVVVESVKKGKLMKDAYEEVAEKTGKTPGSVAFRWNNKVKKKSGIDIKKLKEERKKQKKEEVQEPTDTECESPDEAGLTLDAVFQFLEELKKENEQLLQTKREYDDLLYNYEELEERFSTMKREIEKLSSF